MKLSLFKIVFAFAILCVNFLYADDNKTMSAEDFLTQIRQPFMQPTYWIMQGEIQTYARGKGTQKETIDMELTYNVIEMSSALLLGKTDLYLAYQKNNYLDKNKKPEMTLKMPEKPQTISMKEAGIEPEDITFAFIYWDLLYDFKFEKVKGQNCRVLELKHPNSNDRVIAWFSTNYGFPLQVYYYRNEESKPWRILEFKDFKEYKKDFWFVKTILIRDPKANWRTQLTFEKADMSIIPENKKLPKLPAQIGKTTEESKQ